MGIPYTRTEQKRLTIWPYCHDQKSAVCSTDCFDELYNLAWNNIIIINFKMKKLKRTTTLHIQLLPGEACLLQSDH